MGLGVESFALEGRCDEVTRLAFPKMIVASVVLDGDGGLVFKLSLGFWVEPSEGDFCERIDGLAKLDDVYGEMMGLR